jgi:SAM-dependent methyltransferase
VLNYPERNCPVCEKKEKRVLYRQRFHALQQGSPLTGYDVAICKACGMAFADLIPSIESFDAFYRQYSRADTAYRGGGDSSWDIQRYKNEANYLSNKIADKETSILDIGCGTGGFLLELKKSNFKNIAGLDPSAGCAEYLSKEHNITVHVGTMAANKLTGQKFDLVMALGVLEHLPDLEDGLKALFKLTDDNGLIFVSVPDAAAFPNYADAPYQQFSIEHINFFARQSLINLFDRFAYQPLDVVETAFPMSETTYMPTIYALFKKRQNAESKFAIDHEAEPALVRYIDSSRQEEQRVASLIQSLATAKTELLIWGAGTHTLHLLESTNLGDCNIVAYVDSNTKLQGQMLRGKPILSPEQLKDYNQAVLISSRVFQIDIATQIRQTLVVSNELIFLYEVKQNDAPINSIST